MAGRGENESGLPFSKFVTEPQTVVEIPRGCSSSHESLSELSPSSRKKAVNQANESSTSSLLVNGGKGGHDVVEMISLHHDTEKVKAIIRTSHWILDNHIRPKLWRRLAEMMSKPFSRDEVYRATLKCVFGDEVVVQGIEKIKATVLPPFVDGRFFNSRHLTEEGIDALHRILRVLSYERPDITYCPVLISMTVVLLHYLTEEECYSCTTALLAQKKPLTYFTQTRRSYEVFACAFKIVAKKYCKSACSYIESKNMELDAAFEDWIFWIFTHLPFYHMVRVMDCYLYEGPKILFRVGLAIIQFFYKSRKDDAKFPDRKIEEFCSAINFPPSKLLKVAFGFRDFSKTDLNKVITRVEKGGLTLSSKLKPKLSTMSTGSLDLLVSTSTNSQMVARKEWKHIYSWLPRRVILMRPRLIFSTAEDGCSFKTFYNKVEGYEHTLLVVKTANGHIIGAYCSADWLERKQVGVSHFSSQPSSKYFGTGESLVFQLKPGPPVMYGWMGLNTNSPLVSKVTEAPPPPSKEDDGDESDGEIEAKRRQRRMCLFITGDDHRISIGGGAKGQAIYIGENLSQVSSSPCDTFTNPSLLSTEELQPISLLEVFGFE